MRHHLTFEQWLAYPVPTLFDFFANPDNLPPLMPRWQAARITDARIVPPLAPSRTTAGTVAAGAGTTMTLRFRPVPYSPVELSWDAVITEFAWDDHFCDEQARGPFGYWRHCHRLAAETRDGVPGTRVLDDVTYAMKFGILGEFANLLGGERQVRSIFAYRQAQLPRLLAALPRRY
jgi:ligand-binding SRPBCC domain-containing protein